MFRVIIVGVRASVCGGGRGGAAATGAGGRGKRFTPPIMQDLTRDVILSGFSAGRRLILILAVIFDINVMQTAGRLRMRPGTPGLA